MVLFKCRVSLVYRESFRTAKARRKGREGRKKGRKEGIVAHAGNPSTLFFILFYKCIRVYLSVCVSNLPKKHWGEREDTGLKWLTLSRWGQGKLNLSLKFVSATTLFSILVWENLKPKEEFNSELNTHPPPDHGCLTSLPLCALSLFTDTFYIWRLTAGVMAFLSEQECSCP